MATNLEFITNFQASGQKTQIIDCDNVFSDNYDVYCIKLYALENTAGNNQWVRIRYIDNTGTVITASEYDYAQLTMPSNAVFYENRATSQNNILYSGIGFTDDTGDNTIFYVYNPYNSSSYTFQMGQSSFMVGSVVYGAKGISVHKSAETIRGIRFYTDPAAMGAWNISFYGGK